VTAIDCSPEARTVVKLRATVGAVIASACELAKICLLTTAVGAVIAIATAPADRLRAPGATVAVGAVTAMTATVAVIDWFGAGGVTLGADGPYPLYGRCMMARR